MDSSDRERSPESCRESPEYIDQHYSDEITLASLSEKFYINRAYLSELFKNHVGQTFSDYLIKLRINQAMSFKRPTAENH